MVFLEVVPVSKNAVMEALNSDFKDFEDALQNFSAVYARDITIIITRNTRDYQASQLLVKTPANFLHD